jgi:hypothetical protein
MSERETPKTNALVNEDLMWKGGSPSYRMMVEHARALERSLQQMHADADAGRRIFGAENARLKESLLALEKDAKRWETLCSLLDGSGIFEIPFNANDTFGYACADCVSAETRSELTSAIDAYQVAQWGGVMAWMETKSNARVIKEHREATDAGHAALAASEKEKK